ncbi:MAG: hypothetical protein R2828_18745 [Saprospiraceae bacterium]
MEPESINQKAAIELLKQGKNISSYKISFDKTKIEALDVILLGKNGIVVPEALIYYNDDQIDFEDDPDITEDDLKAGKLIRVINADIPIDEEISDWIKEEKINVNNLLSNLIKSFYQNMKSIPKS